MIWYFQLAAPFVPFWARMFVWLALVACVIACRRLGGRSRQRGAMYEAYAASGWARVAAAAAALQLLAAVLIPTESTETTAVAGQAFTATIPLPQRFDTQPSPAAGWLMCVLFVCGIAVVVMTCARVAMAAGRLRHRVLGSCGACGFELLSSMSERCPECGREPLSAPGLDGVSRHLLAANGACLVAVCLLWVVPLPYVRGSGGWGKCAWSGDGAGEVVGTSWHVRMRSLGGAAPEWARSLGPAMSVLGGQFVRVFHISGTDQPVRLLTTAERALVDGMAQDAAVDANETGIGSALGAAMPRLTESDRLAIARAVVFLPKTTSGMWSEGAGGLYWTAPGIAGGLGLLAAGHALSLLIIWVVSRDARDGQAAPGGWGV